MEGEYCALNTAPPLLTQDHSTVTTTNSVVTSHSDVYQSRSRVEVTVLGALLGKCSSCRVVNKLTVNKLFDYLAYLALGPCLILFTQRPLGPVFLTQFSQCLAKPRSKPFSVCSTLLSSHHLS